MGNQLSPSALMEMARSAEELANPFTGKTRQYNRDRVFELIGKGNQVPELEASVFFAYIYTLYGRHEQEIPLEENLSNEEKQILVNNSAEFLSTFYEFFDTDHMYRLLCTTSSLLGMRYYRTELFPLILRVIVKRDDQDANRLIPSPGFFTIPIYIHIMSYPKFISSDVLAQKIENIKKVYADPCPFASVARIISTMRRHLSIEINVLQLGKDVGMNKKEKSLWKGKPDAGLWAEWTQVYSKFEDISHQCKCLEDEYSLTD